MKKTNHKSLLTLTLFALMLLGAACSDTDTHPNTDEPMIDPPGTLLASDLSRIMDPQVSAEDAKTLVEDNTTFALNLFDEVRDEHENLFFSPHSISIALGMTYAGARANTELEMAGAMEFSLSQELLHPAFNDLDLTLKEAAADNFDLRIVNQLWGQEGEVFVPEFLDSLALHYGAGMRLMDFLGAPEASRATINEWVEDATEERIKDLLPEGSITSDTRLVLTNAIYFLADWSLQFEKEQTYAGAFTLLNGGSSTVDFMNQVATFDYYADGDYQAIALPYAGETATLLAILPDEGSFEDVQAGLDVSFLDNIRQNLVATSINLKLPKVEFETEMGLVPTMKSLGMIDAFTGAADFTGIRASGGLMITDIFHKAFVKIDEEGTEAAAATAVVVGETSAPMGEVDFFFERPYIFLIQDNSTGAVLFMGRVMNPAN